MASATATALFGPWPDSTRPRSRGRPFFVVRSRRLYLCGGHRPFGVGVVYTIKCLSWTKLYNKHIYKKRCAWVWGGPRLPPFYFKLSMELGAPRAGLRYFAAASMLVDLSWCGGDGGKVNFHSFRRRRSSLLLILSLIVA
jgi:hypothetical protein